MKYTEKVSARLTPTERAELEKRAAAEGVTLSEYVRGVIVGHLRVTRARAADPRLIAELKRIGNNLNQIARHVHTHGVREVALLAELVEVEGALRQIAEDCGK